MTAGKQPLFINVLTLFQCWLASIMKQFLTSPPCYQKCFFGKMHVNCNGSKPCLSMCYIKLETSWKTWHKHRCKAGKIFISHEACQTCNNFLCAKKHKWSSNSTLSLKISTFFNSSQAIIIQKLQLGALLTKSFGKQRK